MTKIEKLSLRCLFADWFYLRTNELLTSPRGELAFKRFLEGKTICLRRHWIQKDGTTVERGRSPKRR